MEKFKQIKVGISPALALSLAMAFMLFLYEPIQLFFQNKSEYWFNIGDLFPICVLMFTVMFMLSVAALVFVKFINDRLYYFVIYAYTVVFAATYIQGNYLAGKLPPLDGSIVPWDLYDYQRKYTIILWVAVIVIVALVWKKFKKEGLVKFATYLPVIISMILFVTLTVVCISTNGLEKKMEIAISTDGELEMSTEQNFVIIILDMVDAVTVDDLLENNMEYKEVFRDFTFFKNTMGAYPHTGFAVPFILTGDWFECDELIDPYIRKCYRESPLFEMLESEDYKLGLYEADAPLTDESMYRFENVKDIKSEFSSVVDLIKVQMRLVGLKYAPYDLKKRCLVLPNEIPDLRKQTNDIEYFTFTDSNKRLCEDIKTKGITLTEQKCFRFIHLQGAHGPFKYDKDLNEIENSNYTQSVEASIRTVETYFQALKDAGVYDNTAIIVMSDHGFNYINEESDTPENKQNPILFVKGIGETHQEMQKSNAPISQEDYMTAYNRLVKGDESSEVFDYKEGDQRERRYLLYYLWDRDHMTEYVQTGYAWDLDTLVPTGREFSQ